MPTDDELDVVAVQVVASLERLVDIKDKEADRKGSVGRQVRGEVGRSHPATGKVWLSTDSSDWKQRGECWGIEGRWMDVTNGPGQRERMAMELSLCSRCSVVDECLEYGLREPAGIWGNKLPKERRKIVRERKKVQNG